MTGYAHRDRRAGMLLALSIAVFSSTAVRADDTNLAAENAKPMLQDAGSATPVKNSPIPVQDVEDPLAFFVPVNPPTEKDKLKGDALAWFMTAQLYYTRGDHDKGLVALKKVVELDPESLVPYRALVPALLEKRDLDGAREFALKAANLKSQGIILVQGVALTYARIGRLGDSISILESALPLVPQDKTPLQFLAVHRQLGTLQRLSNAPDKAAAHYRIVFEAITKPDSGITEEQIKEMIGDPAVLFDEFGQAFLNASLPELALSAFNEATKYRPARPGVHSYNLALLFRQTDKQAQALEELDKYFSAQLQTRRRAAYQLLKDLLKDLGRESELLGRLEKLHSVDPQNALLAYFLADEYSLQGRQEDALRIYQSAPGWARDPHALVGLIPIYQQQKKYAELLTSLTTAFQTVPVNSDPSTPMDQEVRELSERFIETTDKVTKDEAAMNGLVAEARKLQTQDPPKLEFFPAYIIGKLCLDGDRTDDALNFYRYAISMQNRPPSLLYREIAVHLIQSDHPQQAAEILEEAIQNPALEAERLSFQQLQAAAYESSGQTAKALSVISEARRDNPDSLELLDREAWIYYHSQQWNKAITAYEALIEAATKKGLNIEFVNRCRFSLSAIYVHIENYEKGEKILEDVLALDPDNSQANNDLGYLWADQNKNLEKARTMIEKALTVEPDNAAYLDSIGWVHYRLGNYTEARDALLKATSDPKRHDATIWDHLGDVYLKMDARDDALKAWIKAYEIEVAKPKPDEKLMKALKGKIPADQIPEPKTKKQEGM